jgi:NAD(P)-dependent dehydrogenase (short-subunit alcohol dehydrogenase family)
VSSAACHRTRATAFPLTLEDTRRPDAGHRRLQLHRVPNALSPGGVFQGQDPAFVARLTNLIPLARMASQDEYKAAVVFLVSDASSYMTGANLVMDGGRTCW